MGINLNRFSVLSLSIAISLALPLAASAAEIGPTSTITGLQPELRWVDTVAGPSNPSIEMELNSNSFDMDQDGQTSPFLRIDRNSPPNSLVISNGGRVGLGTDNPQAQLHVRDSIYICLLYTSDAADE